MDEDIQELKALVKQNLALTQELNHTVRKMRRAAAWNRFFQLVWWVFVLVASWAAYYYYLEPYVGKIEQIYAQYGASSGQSQQLSQEVQNFLKTLTPGR